jgi:small subunit ribosomal protein S8
MMTTSDPIADMLARIRNGIMAKHAMVVMPSSKIKVAIAKILRDEGYIENYRVVRDEDSRQNLVINLKYVGDDLKHQHSVITDMKRVSKPGRRVYMAVKDIPWVRSGMGIAVLSTPKGIITGQQARRLNVGGEVLCYVW